MNEMTWPDFLLYARSGRLILVFAVFVLLQLLFARLYLWLHRRCWNNFSFNVEIQHQQIISTQERSVATLERLEHARAALEELRRELERGAVPVMATGRWAITVALPSGAEAAMIYRANGSRGPIPCSDFRLRNAEGAWLFGTDFPVPPMGPLFRRRQGLPKTADRWLPHLPKFAAEIDQLKEESANRLKSLTTATPDIWSYWDFVYFSTIVQTTVGFGDILPNSTAVRLVVTSQILIGYALLIVVLNIVLG